MLVHVLLILLTATAVFLSAEYIRYKKAYSNETSRKLVHALHAVTLAVLAYAAPVWIIVSLEILFLLAVLVARYLRRNYQTLSWVRYLSQMYQVGRKTWGEIFFPVGAIIAVSIAESPWIFAAAILVLGLADTAAALIGRNFGKDTPYNVLLQRKSLSGSIAFFIVALLILTVFGAWNGLASEQLLLPAAILLSGLLTIAEGLGVYGADNLFIPLIAVVVLNGLV